MPPTKELRMDSHVGMAHVCAPKVVYIGNIGYDPAGQNYNEHGD